MPWDLAELTDIALDASTLSDWRVALTLDGQLQVPSAPPVIARAPDAAGSARCVLELPQVAFELSVTTTSTALTVQGRITSRSAEPVVLGEIYPLYQVAVHWDEAEDEIVVLPYQSWGEERAYALDDPDLPEKAKIIAQAWNRTRQVSLQAAFLDRKSVV